MDTKNSYTFIVRVWQCNDCGAHAKSKKEIEHYDSCVPGDAEK